MSENDTKKSAQLFFFKSSFEAVLADLTETWSKVRHFFNSIGRFYAPRLKFMVCNISRRSVYLHNHVELLRCV